MKTIDFLDAANRPAQVGQASTTQPALWIGLSGFPRMLVDAKTARNLIQIMRQWIAEQEPARSGVRDPDDFR